MALKGARVLQSQVWGMDDGGLLTGEGSDVVIVIIWRCRVGSDVGVFIFSSSSGGARSQWLVALSTSPARADVSGKTARVIAAFRRKKAIRPSVLEGFLLTCVAHCGML